MDIPTNPETLQQYGAFRNFSLAFNIFAMEAQLLDRIRLLNPAQLKELQLFVEFLLHRPELQANLEKKPTMPQEGLQQIALPVSETIIDRSDIYEDRI